MTSLEELQFEISSLKQKVTELQEEVERTKFGTKIIGGLVSKNYVEGSKGWIIKESGDTEFAGGTFRGTLIVGDTSGDAGTFYVEINPVDGKLTHYFEGNIRTVLEDGSISFLNPSGTGGGSIYSAAASANNLRLDVADEVYNVLGASFGPASNNSASCGTALLRWADVRSVLINGADIGFANGWKLREYPCSKEDIAKSEKWMKKHANKGIQLLNDKEEVIAVFHKNGTLYCNDVKPLSELNNAK